MEYRFEQIAYNLTAKRTPTKEDMKYYIGLEHLESGSLYVTEFGSDVEIKGDKLIMSKGDVLLGKRNAYLRRAAIAPHDGLFSAHGMILRPKEEVINKDYFPFFIASDIFFDEAIRISVGGLSPTINWKDLKELVFDLPSLDEQKVLADKLWAAYRVKESYRKLLAATDDMVKAKFVEITHSNTNFSKIGDVCDVRGGSTPTKTNLEFWDNGSIPWFTVEDIHNQGHYITDTVQKITEAALRKTYLYPEETVLICCTASIGEYAYLCRPMTSNQQFNGMMVKDKSILMPKFLLYVASTLKSKLLQISGMTTIHFVSRSTLEGIEIPVPPMELQQQFADIATQAEATKASLRQSIESIDRVIRSLINQ